MKRNLRMKSYVLTLVTALFTVIGCQNVKDCACDTASIGNPTPTTYAYSRVTREGYNNVAEVNTELVCLHKRVPAEATLKEPYEVQLSIFAHENVANVLITDRIPAQARFVRSDPGAMVKGDKMSWNLEAMKVGETNLITYWLEPQAEGSLSGEVSIVALPQASVDTFVGQAVLACTHDCPALVKVGEKYQYNVTIANTGTTAALEVIATEILPKGVVHASGKSRLFWKVDALQPGERKTWTAEVTATATGRYKSVLTADASNAQKVAASAENTACNMQLDVIKVSPETAVIGRAENYEIIVTNPTTETIKQMVVTDHAPKGLRIASAEGACIENSKATWVFHDFPPKTAKSLKVALSANTTGTHQHTVTMVSVNGPSVKAQAATEWAEPPALTIHTNQAELPILKGSSKTFRIQAVNQRVRTNGQTQVVVRLPPGLLPESISGATPGRIVGQTVTFEPFNNLGPKQALEYSITARAVSEGKGKIRAQMIADNEETAAEGTTRTYVY